MTLAYWNKESRMTFKNILGQAWMELLTFVVSFTALSLTQAV
jgi:hypothetical protein